MLKEYFAALSILTILSVTTHGACAVDSTIYTDDLGRMHFMGKGGYSGVRSMQNMEMQSNVVNDAVNKYSNIEQNTNNNKKEIVNTVEQKDVDITSVIKEKPVVPAASYKSSYTYEKGKMDATTPYGYSNTNIPSGVNDSKTIYTDELGRLHFFGKANQIKE